MEGLSIEPPGSMPVLSFGLFARHRADCLTVKSNKNCHIKSTVNELFAVDVPRGSAPDGTELVLKVNCHNR